MLARGSRELSPEYMNNNLQRLNQAWVHYLNRDIGKRQLSFILGFTTPCIIGSRKSPDRNILLGADFTGNDAHMAVYFASDDR